jgi:protein-disulfide isomerase
MMRFVPRRSLCGLRFWQVGYRNGHDVAIGGGYIWNLEREMTPTTTKKVGRNHALARHFAYAQTCAPAKIIRQFALFALGVAVLTANLGYAEEKWVADEIFLQMSEMRKEIQQLKRQVNELSGQVREWKGGKAGIPLAAESGMGLGANAAKVAIMEFSDYECPYCGKHALKALPKLKEKYMQTGAVKYVKRDFPLAFHGQAKKAAITARCAGEQGKYWPMHDRIFEARGKLGSEAYLANAKKLGIKMDRFEACLGDKAQAQRVDEDIALGTKLGVQGTPAFFVGRVSDGTVTDYQRFDGVQSFDTFASVIEGFLKIKR